MTDSMQLLTDEPENEISLTAFRLLTLDLLTLYSVMNEGTINVLGKPAPPYFTVVSLILNPNRTLF
jgi:hypothetical protein